MKQKINIRLAIIAVLAVVATTVGTQPFITIYLSVRYESDLRIEAELIRSMGLLQQIYESLDPEDLNGELQSLNDLTEENLRITWVDADGTVLYDNDKDATLLENHKDRTEIQEAFKTGVGEEVRRSDTLDMDTYYYALKLEDGTVIRVCDRGKNDSQYFLVFYAIYYMARIRDHSALYMDFLCPYEAVC